MQHQLTEFHKILEITGYQNVTFEKADAFLKANRKHPQTAEVQFFDADLIATWEHLYFAVLNALSAFKGKYNISKSAVMETMLYASAQRQIQKAILRCGIKPQTTRLAVVILGAESAEIGALLQAVSGALGSEPDESVLELTAAKVEKICQTYSLTPTEIQTATKNGDTNRAIIDLVIEQAAVLATQL
ncbi:MAG: KEOPS complex subunit Cgi121 [Candidatus Bathyarchaeota archaeon]|nr:KEOPS complex subunit Cgi121 [Candidatus Bathyarchaeota archaeon]